MRARVAALGAVVLVLTACGSSSSSSTQPTGDTGTSFRCPDPSSPPSTGSGDSLPPGATAALICATDGDVAWHAPREALTHGVGRIVSLVNSLQPPRNPSGFCNLSGGPAWVLLVRYADGVRTIAGDDGGCQSVEVGRMEKDGAPRVFLAFISALLRQRAHARPPRTVSQGFPACPGQGFLVAPTAQPRLLARASWCVRDGHRWRSDGALTQAQLRAFQRDLATADDRSSPRPSDLTPCGGVRHPASGFLQGPDAWGDPVRIGFQCGFYVLQDPITRHASYVRMRPATAAMIARQVG